VSAKIDCGRYVGLITRLMPSTVTLEGAEVHMVTECDRDFPVGEYLVIESGDTKYLARISESRVEDIYSIAKTPVLSLEQELAMGVKYIPRFIGLELISECQGNECRPPSTPPRIHSPVRIPSEGEVSEMLSLPRDGVLLGTLALPNGAEVLGNEVRLPISALRHHVLVVGTTGSGKTTLLKNMALELVRGWGKATVIALDTVGHYHHLVMNGVDTKVLTPVTRGMLRRAVRRYGNAVRDFVKYLVVGYVNTAFRNFGIDIRRVRVRCRYAKSRKSGSVIIRGITIEFLEPKLNAKVELIPWALRTGDVLYRVHEITGMLTEQARMFYRRVINEIRRRSSGELTFRGMFEFLTSPSNVSVRDRALLNYEVMARDLGIHTSTLENIIRTILAIDESGIVDVEEGGVRVVEPNYGDILSPGYVVVHLAGVGPMVQRMVVYRVLDRVYSFMGPEHLRDRERFAVVLIDEAHLFFPQARSEDEKGMLELHLTKLTRLGRGRGIAVVFATHMPDDLNDAVLQLTNTKIILRSEEKVLERLGVPSTERRFLATAVAGLAHASSFAYRYPIYVRIRPAAYHVG